MIDMVQKNVMLKDRDERGSGEDRAFLGAIICERIEAWSGIRLST